MLFTYAKHMHPLITHLARYLVVIYVHILSIHTAYLMHTVAKGKLWLLLRVLYG